LKYYHYLYSVMIEMSLLEFIFPAAFKVIKWMYWYYQNEDAIKPAVMWIKHKVN
jgi:hypothetical protein